jgi:hypothetical protein
LAAIFFRGLFVAVEAAVSCWACAAITLPATNIDSTTTMIRFICFHLLKK